MLCMYKVQFFSHLTIFPYPGFFLNEVGIVTYLNRSFNYIFTLLLYSHVLTFIDTSCSVISFLLIL